jgi:3-O-alpha-D-mannopyranosyl-alpha-D-mannopyranose xylosylphosphotransferase
MDEPLNTRIRFCKSPSTHRPVADNTASLDGHLPKDPDKPLRQCPFMPYCLPDNYFTDTSTTYPAEEVFKRIAFERPQCGDCLIDALITASGERGLSAFLPDSKITYRPTSSDGQWNDIGPILPLTKQWRTTNFTLTDVITGHGTTVNLREWCTTLLGRYVYAIGATPAIFAPVASIRQLSHRLEEVDNHPETALVCVNDDISDKNALGATRFKDMLGTWMDRRWPRPGPWERREG